MKSLNVTLAATLVTGISFLVACSGDRSSPTAVSTGNISGAWVGTVTSGDSFECNTSPAPARATFVQNGSVVSGTLTSSATPDQCGFGTVTYHGTMQGNSLEGNVDGLASGSANCALSGGTLYIQIVNVYGTLKNQLKLHR